MDAQAMVMAGVPAMGAICAVALYVVRQEITGQPEQGQTPMEP